MQPEIAPTSLSLNMLARMNRTHAKVGISIFTGPPGIGKTTMINAFAKEHHGCIVRCKIAGKNVSPTSAVKTMLRSLAELNRYGGGGKHVQSEVNRFSNQMAGEMSFWKMFNKDEDAKLTVVFDEAQTLGREAVNALRFWNDGESLDVPFPIGLIFVGNHELSLRVDDKGQSTISAAVASRCLYQIEYGNDALTEADFTMVMAARGVTDPNAAAAVNHYFRRTRDRRDLRALLRLIDDLNDEAGGSPVTLATVQSVLNP